MRPIFPAALALLAAACLSACGPAAPPPVVRRAPQPNATPDQRLFNDNPRLNVPGGNVNAGGNGNAGGPSQHQRQVEFLNRLRQADPQFKTIDRAVLNEQNELGLILDHTVQMDSLPALMRTMLTQLAKEFPGQDLNVVAYAPSTPPLKIGTAHLNAQTRDMSYTPAR